ncbi:MAG: DDE-type integrase/transposase/recombinase [Candidatus Thermoplasmatota archaeon]|nr:DDE-type integrase/transposase/recombinase [Candidatus Thermoplasmatota archaeon]
MEQNQHHLKMFYDLEISRPTVMRWIHKFSSILNDYAEKHRPAVGDLWNSDEMTVKLRETDGKNGNEWIWNLMDSYTRFLLALTITKQREVKDASKDLQQEKKRSGKKPKALITDGLQSYIDANKKGIL